MSGKRYLLAVTVLLLLSSGVRLIRHELAPLISRDGIQYVEMAQNWQEQGFEAAYRNARYSSPLFIWVMKQGIDLGIHPEHTGVACNILIGSLIPLLFLLIGRILFRGFWWPYLAALLAATHPELVELSVEVQRETFYLFFALLGYFLLLLAWRRETRWAVIAAGAAFGFSFLSRLEALELPLLTLAFLCFLHYRERRSWKELGRAAAELCCGWFVAVLLFALIAGIPASYYSESSILPLIRRIGGR